MSLEDRLEQAKKDREAINQNIRELEDQIKEEKGPEYKHGDVFKGIYTNTAYILLKSGSDWTVVCGVACYEATKYSDKQVQENFDWCRWKLTGQNIFNLIKGEN